MKTVSKILLATLVSTAALSASAMVSYGNGASQAYVGGKIGQFQVDGSEKNATAYGVYGGYKFNENFGVEADFVGSDTATYKTVLGVGAATYKTKTYGAYGTYNYNFAGTPFSVKGKAGIAKTETTLGTQIADLSLTDKAKSSTGLAYGVGAGYTVGNGFTVEADYTRFNDSKNGLWTVGANVKF